MRFQKRTNPVILHDESEVDDGVHDAAQKYQLPASFFQDATPFTQRNNVPNRFALAGESGGSLGANRLGMMPHTSRQAARPTSSNIGLERGQFKTQEEKEKDKKLDQIKLIES